MTIKEVYDRLKPIDETLMKRRYMSDSDSMMISVMWQSIKNHIEKDKDHVEEEG